MTATVLPSPEATAVEVLSTLLPDVPSIAVSRPVQVPDRWVTVTLIGGDQKAGWIARPRLQIDAWATDREAADLLARRITAELAAARNLQTTEGITLSGARIVQTPSWLPDTSTATPGPRYSQTVDLFLHPPIPTP